VAELIDGSDKKYFEIAEEAYDTLKFYRTFHDYVYTHDYTFKVTTGPATGQEWATYLGDLDTTFKYCVSRSMSFQSGDTVYQLQKGDLIRYEEYSKKWVPAGVSYDTANHQWNSLNVYTITGLATNISFENVRDTMKAMFREGIQSSATENGIGEFIDVADIAFHQALIKLVSGTDNRAKNTYFQVLGKIMKEVPNPEYDAENNNGVPQTIWVQDEDKNGYKIRLMQDDVDTVLLTDNSGLQTKPYNLLETSYREEDKKHWGDSNNIFFYMFDQCFEPEIKTQLKQIIDFAFANGNKMDNKDNYFYKVYFSVTDMFPAVAYNHTSKIYYENAQFVKNSNAIRDLYTNNNIAPIEQAHGSSISSEKDFMSRRLAFLGSYVGSSAAMGVTSLITASSGGNGDKMRLLMTFEPYQDFYPRYKWEENNFPSVFPEVAGSFDAIKYLAREGQEYSVQIAPSGTAINQGVFNTDLYKKLDITGLYYSNFGADLSHAVDFTVDNNNLYDIDGQGNKTVKLFFG